MAEEKESRAFKVSITGLENTQALVRSIAQTNKALTGLISQNALNRIFDSSAIRQISRIQEDMQTLFKNIGPSLEIAEAFAKQNAAILKSIQPIIRLEGIWEAQANALASIAKINFPVFDFPELIRKQQEFVHENLGKELHSLNEEYFNMWDGPWKAVDFDNPDKIRQSANSMRELFRTLIHHYSDDKRIIEENSLPEKGDITRRHRLSFILKNSKAEEEDIENLDNTIAFALEVDQKMQKATHSSGEEEKFRNLLCMYEGFIWMIIKQKLDAQ